MDNALNQMDYAIAMKKTVTRLKFSGHHTPAEGYRHIFHSVLRAGHYRIAPDFPMRSWSRPGHDLVLGIAGLGRVQIGSRTFTINAGELVWVDCERHDVAWLNRSGPWEFLWTRVDSPQMNPIAEALNVESNPIFKPRKTADAVAVFKSIFKLLRNRPVNMDAALHAAVISLVAVLFDARQSAASGTRDDVRGAAAAHGLDIVLSVMREEYRKKWKVKELAQLMGLSVPQFFRRFHQATGSSPIDWLRRERVNHAKRSLGETRDRIRDIAEHVGYGDPLYFSRDFKKLVGVSPLHYRRQEQANASVLQFRNKT